MSLHPSFHADGVFTAARRLPFSPEQVFAAFANAELLARWWGPAGFRNEFEVFEFRPGGRWQFVMQGPDGTRYPNLSRFEKVSPECIVIRHDCAPYFTLTVTLDAIAGHTQLGWRQAFDDAALAAQLAPVVGPANEQNLDRLQAALASPGSVGAA